jgi:RNA polymerase sigma factor (sigma-70 family)
MARGTLGQLLYQFRRLIAADQAAQTDGQLLERYVTRQDEEAFTSLVERHGRMVLNVCRRVLPEAHDAEDAFQATFLVVVRRAAALDRRGSIAHWLHTVAYHISIRARADAARRRVQERQVADMPAEVCEDAEDAAWPEIRPLLDQELARLPDKYRAPLILCYLEGMTNEQAARELGWPIGSMAKRLARGRELLRNRLVRQGVVMSTAIFGAGLSEHALAATLPSGLVTTTVRAAFLFAAGEAAAGAISAPAVSLAEGALRSLGMVRIKVAAALLLLVAGAAGLGAAAIIHSRATEPMVAVAHQGPQLPPANQPADSTEALPVLPTVVQPVQVITAKEQAVLQKDALEVFALAFAPDGKTLVSAQGTKGPVLIFWDVQNHDVKQRTPVQATEIRTLTFSAGGGQLAWGARDKTAKISDGATGKVVATLSGHGGSIYAVAVAPDGQTLATGSSDKSARLWDWQGKPKGMLAGHADGILAVAFLPHSQLLATGGRDRTVRLWDWLARMERTTLRGHTDWVTALAVSPDGKLLVSGSKDKTIKLWDLEPEPRERLTLEGHTAAVLCVAISPDGRTLATGSEDGAVKLWDLSTGKLWTTLSGHTAAVNAAVFAPDGKTLATGSKDTTVRLWSIERRTE